MGERTTNSYYDRMVAAVRDLGFPIVVAFVMLYIVINQMPQLTQALTTLNMTLGSVNDSLVNARRELSEHRHYTESWIQRQQGNTYGSNTTTGTTLP